MKVRTVLLQTAFVAGAACTLPAADYVLPATQSTGSGVTIQLRRNPR